MKNLLLRAGTAMLVVMAMPCAAQTANSIAAPAGYAPLVAPCTLQSDGICLAISAANPLPVSGISGDGGGSVPTGPAGTPSSNVVTVQGIAGAVALKVDGSATTQPVSAVALPLPAGAATASNQATANASLVSIDGRLAATIKTDTVVQASATDRGLSVTTAGTAQQLMAANSARRGFTVQNQSSGDCYINGQATATQDFHSLRIASGAYYETPSTHISIGAISIVCAVSSASIYAREW